MRKVPRIKPIHMQYPAGWYVGSNDEYLNIGGPFHTREEAIEAGRADKCGDPFYICNAALHSWAAPDADTVMDSWIESHDELWWEDGFDGFCGARDSEVVAVDDLQTVLNDWFERHKAMLPTPTAFCATSDGEWIDRLEAQEKNDEH